MTIQELIDRVKVAAPDLAGLNDKNAARLLRLAMRELRSEIGGTPVGGMFQLASFGRFAVRPGGKAGEEGAAARRVHFIAAVDKPKKD